MMNANNPQTIKEQLSALADGELDARHTDEVIGMACQDQDVRSAWLSAHLARDVMQADYNAALPLDFAARVNAAIEQEPTLASDDSAATVASMADARGRREQRIRGAQPARRSSGRTTSGPVPNMQQPFALWKPVAGFGLAASLAGATFLFSQLLQSEQADPGQLAQAEQPSVTAPNALASTETSQQIDDLTLQAAIRKGNNGTRWRMDNEVPRNVEIEKRLNTLLTNHLEDASMGGVHGLVSHSRVVGYDTVPSEQQDSE